MPARPVERQFRARYILYVSLNDLAVTLPIVIASRSPPQTFYTQELHQPFAATFLPPNNVQPPELSAAAP